ncbi:hypothetical protein QTG54_014276 [Skeletonema marinoi]|uniref:Deacetylase sirtuin-type domain-containing protein n=1 Tax=Skeletonema marinoi TaxID=267567 RepID=A0AAD9D6Z6_9STRA|nr:hypothetical protein QTG54_014276 [Skeletonema marinoi]
MKINDLATLGRFILSPECKSVVILTGAGISVASGITTNDNAIDQLIRPDFRSPGGMYETLRPELITATEKQRRLMEINPTDMVLE